MARLGAAADADRRAREARRNYPSGAWFNFERIVGERGVISHFCPDAGAPVYSDEHQVIGGPYHNLNIAIARARPTATYPYLLRLLLERGIVLSGGKHQPVTKAMLAEWIDYTVPTIESWLRPPTNVTYRRMPRRAIRLIIHEFKHRDHSRYKWASLLKLTQ